MKRLDFRGRQVKVDNEEVPQGCACPKCAEALVDMLHWLLDYEKVECQGCGVVYESGEANT